MALLDAVKTALWITDNDHDDEIEQNIAACAADLGIVGVEAVSNTSDPNLIRAMILFNKANLGTPDDADRIKKWYDELKAMLITATGYGLPEGE